MTTGTTSGATPRVVGERDRTRAGRQPRAHTRRIRAVENGRQPGIWRADNRPRPLKTPTASRPMMQAARGRAIPNRLLSVFIIVALFAVLGILFSSDAFYVHSIRAGGLETLTEAEIFTLSGTADLHVFWVDPSEVRARLLQSPTIANATVEVGWGLPMITVRIEERQPALVWEQGGVAVWVDLQGRIMRQRVERPNLMRVIVDGLDADAPQGTISPEVINGAVQFHALMPDIVELRYRFDLGLGYTDPRGWEVWLGTGTNMPEKVMIYNALTADLSARGILPQLINVGNPDSPHWCCRPS